MKIEPGCPVQSMAGHDKGRYYVVVADEGERIALADGRTRTVASPKRKNRRHIRAEKEPLPVGEPMTDEAVRRELKQFLRRMSSNPADGHDQEEIPVRQS